MSRPVDGKARQPGIANHSNRFGDDLAEAFAHA
jgi:hypothetical protein